MKTSISLRGSAPPRWRTLTCHTAACLGSLLLLPWPATVQAAMAVVGGETITVADLRMDFACTDLTVHGTLNLTRGELVNVGQLHIAPGGQLNVAGGTVIGVSRGWRNQGTFQAGNGVVQISGACGTTTAFEGNSAFHHLSATSPGQTLTFAAGSAQTIESRLILNSQTLVGNGGSAALSLTESGEQDIESVGVHLVDATLGQRLAPTQTNQTVEGLAPNWFAPEAAPPPLPPPLEVPANGPAGLLAAALGLLGIASRRPRRKAP